MLPLLLLALIQPTTATSIEVPAGQHLILTAQARGFQVYRCAQIPTSPTPQWIFVAPEATLFSNQQQIATHGAGPTWHNRDGSSVQGTVLASTASANLASIPQLLLQARKTEGKGVFAGVTYIQRKDTSNGLAPQTGCDSTHLNELTKSPYTATYRFFAAD